MRKTAIALLYFLAEFPRKELRFRSVFIKFSIFIKNVQKRPCIFKKFVLN